MRLTILRLGALFLVLLPLSSSAASMPSLVLITLESTRADRMGFLGAKGGLTPNLDRLAAESMVFEHAYAQAPGTVVSHASILSGAYPQATGMSETGGTLPQPLAYLPDILKARGYRCAAFVGSIELDPRNGTAQGFERGFASYDAGFVPVIPGDQHPPVTSRKGDEVAGRAAAWIAKNLQGQFFLWIQINDPGRPSGSYNSAIASADAAVGKVLAALKQQGIYDKTAVAVLADHGEGLGSHGEDAHGIFLYDETIHVPLLVKVPAGPNTSKQNVTGKVRLVDVAPTLLEIAGVAVPSHLQGQSLLRAARATADQPVYSRAELPQNGFGWSTLESWRAGKYLYVRAPKPELYDMTADSEATHNLAQTSKATLDTMSSQLETFDRRFSGPVDASTHHGQLSQSEMQKLSSLGYVGLEKSQGAALPVTGTDPKDKISTANRVIAAASVAGSRPDRAAADLQPVVSSDPGLYLSQYTLGVALAQKGQFAEAVKHLHKAIELQPDSAWAHFQMGACLLKTGDRKTAVVHLEIAASRLPGFAPSHEMLAAAKM